MIIDAHQHFWQFDPIRDTWITADMAVIQRDFLPTDLQPLLAANGMEGCVAVQADQSLEETDFLLGLAEQHDCIKAVVGWVDLKSENLTSVLEQYTGNPYFKGVRHIVQAESAGFMTDPRFVNGIKTLAEYDLSYDMLIGESQLDETIQLIQQLPEIRLVMDHIAKPNIKEASFSEWAKRMKEISRFEHVSVKLSGLVTEADWQHWKPEDFTPYIDFCLETFGPDRLMYGSDWPVCLLAGSYAEVYGVIAEQIAKLTEKEQAQIMGGTTADFYNL